MPAPKLEQIDIVLAEDGRTVMAYGYETDDTLWLQSFGPLPMPIDEEKLDRQQWRAAARPDAWRLLA